MRSAPVIPRHVARVGFLVAAALAVTAALAACSQAGEPASPALPNQTVPIRDASTTSDASADADAASSGDSSDAAEVGDARPDSSDADAGLLVVNGCTSDKYVDGRGADAGARTIVWDDPPTTPCLKIARTQTVTWSTNPAADFGTHPLEATPGTGSPNSPITTKTSGATLDVAFNTLGVFGFNCQAHSTMTGAIWVVE